MKITGFQDTIDWYKNNIKTYTKGYYKYGKGNEFKVFAELVPKHAKVLDAGCAAGRDSKYLVEEGLDVVGVDLVEAFIKKAREHVPEGEFLKSSFLDLPFDDETFDGVWSNASLLHFETVLDVKKALREFYRVIKLGGILYVNVKAQTGDKKFAVIEDSLSKHKRFFQFFTHEEIQNYIKEAGFEISTTEQYNERVKHPEIGRGEVEWIACFAKKI